MPGWLASPRVAIDEVLVFLDRVDDETAQWARQEVVPLTSQLSQRFVSEAVAHHRGLPDEVKDALTVGLADLVERVRFGRVHHTRKVGVVEYEWALRCAVTAQQLDAQFREADRSEGKSLEANARETAIADNVRWMLDVVDRGERIVFGAHNGHLQRTPFVPVGMTSDAGPAGAYLDAMLAAEYVPIGTTFGSVAEDHANVIIEPGEAIPGPAPDGTIDAVLSALGEPVVAVDLRAAVATGGAVASDLNAIRSMRAQNFLVATDLAQAFDVLIHVDVVSGFTPRAVERDDA